MKKLLIKVFLNLIFILLLSNSILAKTYLVKIGNETYTKEDFKNWWKYWKEPEQPFIETIDPYVKWLLFLKEAEKMNLQENPTYKRKLLVYLKVISLLRLQKEEIYDKLKINEKELKDFYYQEFTPIFHGKIFYFEKEEEALKFKEKIKSVKDCKYVFDKFKGLKSEFDARPRNFSGEIKKIFRKIKKPHIFLIKEGNMWQLYCVEKIKEGDEQDYKKMYNAVVDNWKRRKKAELTEKLINRLKKKYKIKLNKELFEKVTLEEPSPEIRDKIVLQIDSLFLTVERFYQMLKRDAMLRRVIFRNPEKNPEELKKLKEFVINNVITQNLIDLEALSRHYEKKEPLKSQYEFFRRNFLVNEFINYVIAPRIKITDKEIEEYLKEYEKTNKPEEIITAIMIETMDEFLLYKIENERKKGKALETVLRDFGFKNFLVRKKLSKFPSKVREAIKNMKPGEIKKIKGDRYYYLVKLLDKRKIRKYDYEKLKSQVREMLKNEKLKEEKERIYKLLKKEYNVKINYKEWENLKREFVEK